MRKSRRRRASAEEAVGGQGLAAVPRKFRIKRTPTVRLVIKSEETGDGAPCPPRVVLGSPFAAPVLSQVRPTTFATPRAAVCLVAWRSVATSTSADVPDTAEPPRVSSLLIAELLPSRVLLPESAEPPPPPVSLLLMTSGTGGSLAIRSRGILAARLFPPAASFCGSAPPARLPPPPRLSFAAIRGCRTAPQAPSSSGPALRPPPPPTSTRTDPTSCTDGSAASPAAPTCASRCRRSPPACGGRTTLRSHS